MKVSAKEYAKIIVKAAEKGISARELAPELWQSLYQNKQLKRLDSIISLAEEISAEKNNQLLVKILSAKPLDDDQLLQIKHELKRRYQKEIIVTTGISADIGAGIQIISGDKIIDYSTQNQIDNLLKHINQ